MGSSDIPPSGAPSWLIPASTACLAIGIFAWLLCYILMAQRSLATNATPAPILALGINLAWEVVYAIFVTDSLLERIGFTAWLICDVPVLYATLKTAPSSYARTSLVGRRFGLVLGVVFAWGVVANVVFARWWLAEPHRGYGVKSGKMWNGMEARDTTELCWWSAGVAQMVMSVGALAMLLERGHSGGQSYGIWLCRFIGTQMGLPVTSTLLWWYWPEAHGFILHPLSFLIMGTSFLCDLAYPFVLRHVKAGEYSLPDGTIVSEHHPEAIAARRVKSQ